MLRLATLVFLATSAIGVAGCANNTVVKTGEVSVEVDETVDFTEFQTFSVVTKDLIDPPPELEDEQEAFNDLVNSIIVEAMQAEPVCLEFIPSNEADTNTPDLWAANGLGRSQEGGYYYECCGGWWWGYWGWYWDPCAYWCPNYVEYDVGSLLVPVALPLVDGEDPAAVFVGLAQSIAGTGADAETKVREAVRLIFQDWPDPRSCPPTAP